MAKAQRLDAGPQDGAGSIVFGVCAAGDPRIDQPSRDRTVRIVERIADLIAENVTMPDGQPVSVVWSPVLIDGESQADVVARQFKSAGVDAIVCTPDTWAFPQLSLMSLMAHFPSDMPLNITCGNSAPKPGVVFAHAVNGALAQSGRLSHLNVGSWPDTGECPEPAPGTVQALVDWCYAALTCVAMRGRRVVVFGHDSMGMETALAHVIPTRRTFGLEITRLDMKLLSDMLAKKSFDEKELDTLIAWLKDSLGDRLDLSQENGEDNLGKSMAMYLIMRDLMSEVSAIGGGFMNQLEWGSDPRGIPLPIADMAESLFNTTFDHNGRKQPLPFATEADVQGLLTMLVMTWLSGGNPPLFMDFRKVWTPEDVRTLADGLGVGCGKDDVWAQKGFVDGDNSGSASLDWAAMPGSDIETIMNNVHMPGAELYYFQGGGNSVTFISPGGIDGIAGRMAFSDLSGMFSMIWDEAFTVDLPDVISDAVANSSNVTWPHTFVVPKYASMTEYKQYAPANHFHMIWNLNVARLQYWMDLTNVLSVAPWQARPGIIEGTDRPLPLMYLINGGENATKRMRARGS
jgi:L-fucose isomerase